MRQTLCKTVLRVLALNINHANKVGSEVDPTFYHTVLQYLKYERNHTQDNIIGYLFNDPVYGSYNLFNKLSVKMLMVSVIQKSFAGKITQVENQLLNLLKQMVCDVGIFENQLSTCEQ